MKDIKFEDAIKQLEKIVADLETGDMSLDDSLSKYEEGIKLSKVCTRHLEAAKSKVELLMKSGDGFKIKPFAETAEENKTRTKSRRPRKNGDSPQLF